MAQDRLYERLTEIVGAEGVLADEPMSLHTTFEVGGPADLFVRPATPEQVRDVMDACRAAGEEVRVIGKGSDLLVADEGLRCAVVQIADNMARVDVDAESGTLEAQAGASNADVAEAACAAGLSGYEFACGIPGSIGGAAIMNAGAYDGQFSDVAESVTCLTREGATVVVPAAQAKWGYRQSLMNDEGMVVLSARLALHPAPKEGIRARMDDLTARREAKQPLDMPSAGSTFKRPEGHYAGKLIQDAGLQGFSVGGAEVSRKHAGFVVNADHATADDVRRLIAQVQIRVFAQTGVKLEPEVRMWGFGD